MSPLDKKHGRPQLAQTAWKLKNIFNYLVKDLSGTARHSLGVGCGVGLCGKRHSIP